MWFPERVRSVASVDVEPAIRALEKLDESAWFADEELKKKLAGDRPTQSLFFYSMSKEEYVATLASRPIVQADVKNLEAYDRLFHEFSYLFEAIQDYYPRGGVFLRAQIARMPPGGSIKEHKDNLLILENTNRLHIPIITTPKLKFFVDNERVTLEAGNIYELNNQLNHWVENPKDSINRIHLIVDYLPPEYNIPASANENFKFYIREHRSGRVPKASDLNVDPPKVVAIVAHPDVAGKDSQAGFTYALHLVDFKSKTISKMFDWRDLNASGLSPDISAAPSGVAVTDKDVMVAAGGEIHFFNKEFKHKASYQTPCLNNARSMMCDGKYLYVVSQGTDSVVRFDIKKKQFDVAWRFYVDESSKIAVKKIFLDRNLVVESSNLFGLNSLTVNGGNFLVCGDKLSNLIKLESGRVDSGGQIPSGTTDIVNFNKGIAFANPDMQQVVYMADYDYRTIKSGSFESAVNFSRGLCRYLKGTLLVGTQPASVALLDMKNQSVISKIAIDDAEGSIVLGLDLMS